MLSERAGSKLRRLSEGNATVGSGDYTYDKPEPQPDAETDFGGGGPATTGPVCNTTEEEVDEAMQCPPVDEVVCGSPMGVDPDGNEIRRPFKRVKTVCVPGCECEETEEAGGVGSYRYEPCHTECDCARAGLDPGTRGLPPCHATTI